MFLSSHPSVQEKDVGFLHVASISRAKLPEPLPRTNTSHTSPSPPPSQKLPFHCCRFQFSLHFEPRSEHGGLCQTGVLVASAKDGEGRPVGRVEMSNCERGTKNHNLYQSFHTFVKGAFTFHQKNCERVNYL